MATDISTAEVDRLLKEGQAAARNGDMASARTLLTQVVERDPHNERAWMWLSGVVLEPEEQQICLENVLVINPHNTKARKGLEYISAKTGISPNVSAPPSEPTGRAPKYTAPLSSDFSRFGDMVIPTTLQQALTSEPAPQLEAATSAPVSIAPGFDQMLVWEQPSEPAPSGVSPFGLPVQWPAADISQSLPVSTPSDSLDPAVYFQPTGGTELELPDTTLSLDVQPFSPDATLSAPQEPLHYAYDPSLPIPADSGLPPWSIDPRVPAYDGSSILQMDDTTPQSSVPTSDGAEIAHTSGPYDGNVLPAANVSPVGPPSSMELPPPTDLPGFTGVLGDQSQPWYLQAQAEPSATPRVESTDSAIYTRSEYSSDEAAAQPKSTPVATIQCPNCKASTPDTSMTCPNCNFSFFVSCPHCHELVDVSDARPGVKSPCPYCKVELNMMDMGLDSVKGQPSYQSTPLKGGMVSGPAMQSFRFPSMGDGTLNFGWLVNIVWLVVVVTAVWAMTQLPTWLHLTGQY